MFTEEIGYYIIPIIVKKKNTLLARGEEFLRIVKK